MDIFLDSAQIRSNNIGGIQKSSIGAELAPQGESFRSLLEKSVQETHDLLSTADKTSIDLAVGKVENLHEATMALEKAETALKLLMQVRNKALEAYHEIMRMQI